MFQVLGPLVVSIWHNKQVLLRGGKQAWTPGAQSHIQTLKNQLGLNPIYYTFTLILLMKIALCSKIPSTKFTSCKCFEIKSPFYIHLGRARYKLSDTPIPTYAPPRRQAGVDSGCTPRNRHCSSYIRTYSVVHDSE